MKSSCRSPGTKRPLASDTVAVTLISSTPLLKRKPCSSAPGRAGGGVCGVWPPATTTTAAKTIAKTDRARWGVRIISMFGLRRVASVDVRDDAFVSPEAHAVASDIGGTGDRDDEGRFAIGPQRRWVDGSASARQKTAIAAEKKHHRGQSLERCAGSRIAHDAAHDQPIAIALVAERLELER